MRYWFSRKGFNETVMELDTPFKISSWLIANVEYTGDVGDYFVMWADEVTITQNLFNRLVAFWISK